MSKVDHFFTRRKHSIGTFESSEWPKNSAVLPAKTFPVTFLWDYGTLKFLTQVTSL